MSLNPVSRKICGYFPEIHGENSSARNTGTKVNTNLPNKKEITPTAATPKIIWSLDSSSPFSSSSRDLHRIDRWKIVSVLNRFLQIR